MTKRSPFPYFKTSPEVIRLAVMLYIRFPQSLRNIEDLPHERGMAPGLKGVRYWRNRLARCLQLKLAESLPPPPPSGAAFSLPATKVG